MGKSSKAALEADQRMADSVKRSIHYTRRLRSQFYSEAAEIASRHGTGLAAAQAILAELRRAHDEPAKSE